MSHDQPNRQWIRPINICEYVDAFLADVDWRDGVVPDRISERTAQLDSEVTAAMQPGDELWQWETETRGFLLGAGGVAIRRSNVTVREWEMWRA